MKRKNRNYSSDQESQENNNPDERYSITGESQYSRDSTIPFDEDEVLSERHYFFGPLNVHGRKIVRSREPRSESSDKQNFRGKGPKGYKRLDQLIKDDACEALYRNTEVDASDIEVFVDHGRVTLKGIVKTRNQKKMAERAVVNLAGVSDVFNEISLKSNHNSIKPSPRGLIDNITGLN